VSPRPYVTIFSTMTIDGRIASSTRFSELSCPYDLARLRLLRGAHEAVMVGANTVLIDNPTLRKRLEPRTNKYYRVVVDGRLRLTPGLRIFREPGPKVIVVTASDDEEKIAMIRKTGADVIVSREPSDPRSEVNLREALQILYEQYGIQSVLVEGGGSLNYSLLRRRVVDELRATITPYIFGAGVSIVNDYGGTGFRNRNESPKLVLKCTELCPCGQCVHIVYSVLDKCCEPVLREPPIQTCLSKEIERAVKGLSV